ncbi:MAG: galactokinase [Firmicutes bacterium]|nr:galactokinase [Bacillota bacterium]
MNKTTLINDFKNIFKSDLNPKVYFSPGRVNLIGEHIDYNGGYVFPCAINLGTYALSKKTKDSTFKLYSKNFENTGIIKVNLENISYNPKYDWANYPLGIIKTLIDEGYNINSGLDIYFYGDIPNGAGLSSSASIELATIITLKDMFNLDISMLDMIKLSQKSENTFNNVKCGIMDQFACGMAKKNYGTLLNTNTLSYKYVPLYLKDTSIIITNSNIKRGLTDSKYNERIKECKRALKAFKKVLDINTLCDLTEQQFKENKHLINNPLDLKRARHAIYENQRTINSVKALNNGNLKLFGKLMTKSHISLKDDYEVSIKELDLLVDLALKNKAIGSRMTGAGFGGCTISLVSKDNIKNFIKNVGNEYTKETGYKADFYIVTTDDGARILQ